MALDWLAGKTIELIPTTDSDATKPITFMCGYSIYTYVHTHRRPSGTCTHTYMRRYDTINLDAVQ